MCLTNPLRRFLENTVNIQTYKHISQKRISGTAVRCLRNSCPKFQGNNSVLKCDRVWLFDQNLLSKHSSLSYIVRSDFQAKILKEIRNKYSELLEYNIHALSVGTATDRDSIAIVYFLLWNRRDQLLLALQNIYEDHSRVWL